MKKTKLASLLMMLPVITSLFLIPDADGYPDASCHVAVQITTHTSTVQINGQTFPRQNPDGTYYPDDAFDFTILVSWTKNCWNIYPQPIRASNIALGTIKTGQVSYDENGGQYFEYGHAEIGTSSSASISQVVEAYGLLCGMGKCYRGYTSGSGSYAPQILLPQVTISLKLENLTDRDGYEMRNKDGTYYTWDGINIVFEPQYKWKDERIGTIDTDVKSSSDIPLIARYQCHQGSCQYKFSNGMVLPWSYNFKYEEGHVAYNSTLPRGVHMHLFTFDVMLYNLGRKIGEGHNSTDALVVQYKPVYTNYPYTILKDSSSWWGFGKSPAVALHYQGSIGGGQDDGTATIHPDRRSKINSFSHTSFAYRLLTAVPLNESMTWAGAYGASFVDGNFSYRDDSLQPGKGSAMFVRAGYGKIVFHDPILYAILKTRYDNSSMINTLQSANFAGYSRYNLTGYYFGYPHTKFSTDVIVISLHSDGSINRTPLVLDMVPDYAENATYEQDFVRAKVIHDRDRIFAGMVLDDMYQKQDKAQGSGVINMRANLTSMVMPDVYRVFAQDPFDLPLNLVYEQPSPYNVTITAGTRKLSFIERGFEFDSNWRYIVNTDQDNVLNGTRYQGLAYVYPDNDFGPYTQILVNGKVQSIPCTGGCTIFLPDRNTNATIAAFNSWGGKASKVFPYYDAGQEKYRYGEMMAPVLMIVFAAVGYGMARRYWGTIASALGFE